MAVVVAATPEQARYAATLVQVSYDEQPPELNPGTASRQVFPELFAGVEKLQKPTAAARQAIAAAPVRVERAYESPVYHHNPIELLASIASWEERDGEDYLTLHDTTRAVDMLRGIFAESFALPPANICIISKFIGGAFGSKAWTYHNPLLVALAARVVRRPLKVEWQQQGFAVGGHRPALRQTLRLGATPEGRLLGLVHESRTHSSMVSGYTEFGARMTRMMYDVPHLGYSNQLAHLNLPTPSVMRGPGFLLGGCALETALDELATELKLDLSALRLQN